MTRFPLTGRLFSSNHRERTAIHVFYSVSFQCQAMRQSGVNPWSNQNRATVWTFLSIARCFDHESKGGPSPYSHRNSVNHESVPLPGTHYLKYIVTNVMNYRGNNSVNPESTMFQVRRNRRNLSCKWRVENIFKVKLMKSFDKRWSRFNRIF